MTTRSFLLAGALPSLLAAALGCATADGVRSSGGGGAGTGGATTGTTTTSTSSGPACDPVDPKNDGTPCSAGCPAGQACAGTTCRMTCDPADQATCPCDRLCAPLTGPGGGGACLPGNAVGQRCNAAYGEGGCAQGLLCVSAGGASYCGKLCAGPADCPAQTFCGEIKDGSGQVVGKACAFATTASGLPAGAACGPGEGCATGTLCDGTCEAQCDGPGGICAAGTCAALTDGGETVGYVCR